MRIRRSENIWRAYDNYWVLGLMRFSLVMRANWDFYECNKILSLHNNELPCFSHRIIIHTSNQPKHIFLSELNRALCKCCSSSTVENDSITTRGLFSNYYLFFSCSCTIILLLITHPKCTRMTLFISTPYTLPRSCIFYFKV